MSFLQGGVLLIFVVACVAQDDFSIDCKVEAVLIKWPLKLTLEQLQNPYTVLLGNCVPSSVTADEVLFHVAYNDCLFRSMVFGSTVAFVNLLTYRPGLNVPAQSHMVECIFDRAVLDTSKGKPIASGEEPMFTMELMNDDFSGPAPSSTFLLASKIHVRASVTESTIVPQQVYLDECIMTTSLNLHQANDSYTVVNNAGCLLQSKYGNATLHHREKPSEILFSLMAIGIEDAKEVYLHCLLFSWEAHVHDVDKKACAYSKERQHWELLDNASQNFLCSCCETICQRGPRSSKGSFWLLRVGLPLVLLTTTGALAFSYYLCWWRGGRLGYRPTRELFGNKY